MTEKAAEVDQLKGSTLEEMSILVDDIMRQLQSKKRDLQPLISQMKVCPRDIERNSYFRYILFYLNYLLLLWILGTSTGICQTRRRLSSGKISL